MFALFVNDSRRGVTTFGIIVNASVTATMMPYCVFVSALARPAAAEAPPAVVMLSPSLSAVKPAEPSDTVGESTQNTVPLLLASRPREGKQDASATADLGIFGGGPLPKSLWEEVISADTASPSPPPEKLRLASLPTSPLLLDPFLFSAVSRKSEQEDPVPDAPVLESPSPDVETLLAEYLPEKIESLVETAAALEEPAQSEGEITPPATIQEETQALFLDSETSELKNPPVELFPGVRIAALAPVKGEALKATARKATKVRMKSGEGEGEPEGEAEGEGEANPFDSLDLESDFVVFLDSFFEEYTPGQETTADLNAFTVQTTEGIQEILPAPNGIFDLAELLLLQRFLQDETLDFSQTGGPSHEDAVDRWEYFETLYGPVVDPELAPVYRVGLAYSCLDDFMSIYLGAALLSITTEVELDGMNVLAALQTSPYEFCQSADIDGDEYSALLEWQHFGTDPDFETAYAAYEAAVLNPAVYPASVDLCTVTRTCGQNILLFYPPEEKVAEGRTLAEYAVFGYDPALFTHEPRFDHWVITGESALSPRYSGADQVEVVVDDDVTIEHVVLALDLSTSVTFTDAALEAAVRTAIDKPTGTLLLGDVYDPEFTELSATNAGIVSLDGLQYCRYLTSLDLSRNNVVTLTPLASLYRLTSLDLGCNVIEDVTPLANLHDLKHLELGIMFLSYLSNPTLVNNNRPEDLTSLVSLKRLEYLGLTDTGLEEEALAPLAALDTLVALSIGKSPGVDLSPVASMDGLLFLIDHDSDLTDTDLEALSTVSGLMAVFLYNNDLGDLDALANCTNMQEIYISNNPIFSVVPNTFPHMIVFNAEGCNLSDISNLGDLELMREVVISHNRINDITPLLNIENWDAYPIVNLLDNPLVHPQSCAAIDTLQSRGVEVVENVECQYSLSTSVEGQGTITPDVNGAVYPTGAQVPISAIPSDGWHFSQWTDASLGTDSNILLTMNANKTVVAVFAINEYTLTYIAGANGSVSGSLSQVVNYGSDGTQVVANSEGESDFVMWTPDGSTSSARIDSFVTRDIRATANFSEFLQSDMTILFTFLDCFLDADINGILVLRDSKTSFGPNGIPDMAEAAMVEAFLSNPNLDFSNYGGTKSEEVKATWLDNLSFLSDNYVWEYDEYQYLDNYICDLAAYLTLGDRYSISLVLNLIGWWGVPYHDFLGPLECFLGPDGDADGDGLTNREEWETTVLNNECNEGEGQQDFEGLLHSYVSNVLNHEEPGIFVPCSYQLDCAVQGQGLVSPSSGIYPAGSNVALTEWPKDTWAFDAWYVNDSFEGNSPTLSVQINEDLDVTAVFVPEGETPAFDDEGEAENVFHDPRVRAIIRSIICELPPSSCSATFDDLMSVQQLQLLDSPEQKIEDIEGIEYLLNLEELDLSSLTNDIDLTPLLILTDKDNHVLKHLYLPFLSDLGQKWACDIVPELEKRGVAVFSDGICSGYLGKEPPTGHVSRQEYPKLVNYYHVPFECEPEELSEKLAQWDVVILNSIIAEEFNLDFNIMKELHPDMKILLWMSAGVDPDLPGMDRCENSNWYQLYTNCQCADECNCECLCAGEGEGESICLCKDQCKIPAPWGSPPFIMNPNSGFLPFLEGFLRDYFIDALCEYPGYDGFLFDCLWATPHSDAGNVTLEQYCNTFDQFFKNLRGYKNNLILTGNAGYPWPSEHLFYEQADGNMSEESFNTAFPISGNPDEFWDHFWNGYQACMDHYRTNLGYHFAMTSCSFDNTNPSERASVTDLTQWDLQRMRLGLGSTLLDDGYFGFSRGGGLHGQLWWFDEYDANLGGAAGQHEGGTYGIGSYNRDFDNGLVIVNTNSTNWAYINEGESKPDPWTVAINPVLPGLYKDVTTKRVGMCFDILGLDARIYEKGSFVGEIDLEDEEGCGVESEGEGECECEGESEGESEGEVCVNFTYVDVIDSLAKECTAHNFDPRLTILIELISDPRADLNGSLFLDMSPNATPFIQCQGNGIPDIACEFGVLARFLNEPSLITNGTSPGEGEEQTLTHEDAVTACQSNAQALITLHPEAWKILGVLAPELRDLLVAYVTLGDGDYSCTDEGSVFQGSGSLGVAYAVMYLVDNLGIEHPALEAYAERIAVTSESPDLIPLSSLQANGDADGDGYLNAYEWISENANSCCLQSNAATYLNSVLDDDE